MTVRLDRSWAIAIVMFLSFTLTVGVTQYAFGVFVTDLEDDLGWSRTEVTAAVSFFAMASIAAPPVGALLDRYGARPVMAASVAALAISLLPRPWMTELWQFYALNAIQYAAMPGAVLITVGRVVGMWFEENRGRAMGLTATGANVGGIIFSSLTALLISSLGWQGAYFVYGLLFLALLPAVLLVIRERESPGAPAAAAGERPGPPSVPGTTVAEAVRSRSFYLLAGSLLLAQLAYGGVLPQIVPHLESVGVSKAEAAAALSVFALCGMGGKVAFGTATERYPSRYIVGVSLGCQVVGLWILVAAGSSSAFWLAVPVIGVGFGALGALIPLVTQETFGLRSFGAITGLVSFSALGTRLLGPLFVGASFDATGSYGFAFTAISFAFIAAALAVAFARPHRRATVAEPAPAG